MLTDLTIKNIAIIDTLHVSFPPGMTVLTGETGAGKSIIIDAVNLVLGGRASGDLIRSGTDEASVEALFDLSDAAEAAAELRESGVETDGELLVKRTVSRTGRNRVFLNGGLATTAQLGAIVPLLINIYGQHESQTLLRPGDHRDLLDGFGQLLSARAAYDQVYADHRHCLEALRSLERDEQEAARRLDLLTFQSQEIAAAALSPGEDDLLEQERQLLAHADRLFQGTQGGYQQLYGDDSALLSRLAEVRRTLADCAAIDPRLVPLDEIMVGATLQIEDAALALRDYASRIDVEPARLQAVDDRLDLIRTLKKKYAPTIEELLELKDAFDREREHLLHREENKGSLERRREELTAELQRCGNQLTALRRNAGDRLASAMSGELRDLAMKEALFLAHIQPLDEPGPSGLDRVEFLFSPNPGEPPRPLARIASGGELSRLMLALKQVHPESAVPTLVFDEVDTGIGGAVSALVGEKLRNVARQQQVLCITHLPQVAAHADHHIRVEKRIEGGRTTTAVAPLDDQARIEEMARMLGGLTITETTRQHAREMIEAAKTRADSSQCI